MEKIYSVTEIFEQLSNSPSIIKKFIYFILDKYIELEKENKMLKEIINERKN